MNNDFYNLSDIDKEITSIYKTYLDTIAPLTKQLELNDGEYPVEILNEIRAIFTHFARCQATDVIEEKVDNIKRAKSHEKRALLDCFKYLCVSYDDQYKEFQNLYKNVDLSVVDNGVFLEQLCQKRALSQKYIKEAQKVELEGDDSNCIFSAYQKAFNAYADVYNMIQDAHLKLIRVKTKAARKARWRVVLDVSGIVGTIFGIIGVILAIKG